MNPILQSTTIIISALYFIYLLTVMVRFSIVSQRISIFNPIYNAFYQLSNKPIQLIEKVIPKTRIDLGSLIYAYLVSLGVVLIMCALYGVMTPYIIAWGALLLISTIKTLIFFGVILIVIASWIAPTTDNPALLLIRAAIDPVIDIFRKIIPTLGGLDLSPIFLIISLSVIEALLLTPLKYQLDFPRFLMML